MFILLGNLPLNHSQSWETIVLNPREVSSIWWVLTLCNSTQLVPTSAFANIFAIWFWVLQKCNWKSLFSILFLRKWCLMLMCLVLLCWTGFFSIFTALMLLQNKGIQLEIIPKSSSYCLILRSWAEQDAKTAIL